MWVTNSVTLVAVRRSRRVLCPGAERAAGGGPDELVGGPAGDGHEAAVDADEVVVGAEASLVAHAGGPAFLITLAVRRLTGPRSHGGLILNERAARLYRSTDFRALSFPPMARCHFVSSWSSKTSAGSAGTRVHAPARISISSWPGPHPL